MTARSRYVVVVVRTSCEVSPSSRSARSTAAAPPQSEHDAGPAAHVPRQLESAASGILLPGPRAGLPYRRAAARPDPLTDATRMSPNFEGST